MLCWMSSCQKLQQEHAEGIHVALVSGIPAGLASFRGLVA